MLNEIQVGRINGILHKLLDMKEGAPAPTLATDVFPMLALEVDRPEWKFLAGERLCWMRWTDAAVAGQYSHVGLRNPAGSGVLIITDDIRCFVGSSASVALGIRPNTTVDSANAGYCRDSRQATQSAVGQATTLTAVAAGMYPMFGSIMATWVTERFPTPVILHPGFELLLQCTTVNISLTAAFSWRERALNPSETR
jgi:hypothetical protein